MSTMQWKNAEIYDVLIIGAGLSGICTLFQIRERFSLWHVEVLEAGNGVGGTWYWNHYPGACFDSESVSYGYSFDKELLKEWHWKEAFSSQPETLRYIRRFCEKHDLAKHIRLNTRITTARWQGMDRTWLLSDEAGNKYTSRFLVTCLGFLSSPTTPAIPGIDAFQGEAFHSSRWPKDLKLNRDFVNKRIGVIGTGASGTQIITAVSKEPSIKSLHVFQRTANWCAPLRNYEITAEQMDRYKASGYDKIFAQCAASTMGLLHQADPRKSSEVTHDERIALWNKLYNESGLGKWLGVFNDTYTDRTANKLYSDWMADKIRARVDDPIVAETLIPKTHGFGTRRVPLESGYLEAFNQGNVRLIDLQNTPIEKATEKGVVTSDGQEHELDILIFATGFDAITGAFRTIDWHSKGDRPLLGISSTGKSGRAIWVDHQPRTFLGLTVPSMPNMFMVLGPHQPFGNATRSIEHAVSVILDLLQFCKDNNYTYVEPTQEAVDQWTAHVFECSKGALSNEVDSWGTGVNKNVIGKTERTVARYTGSTVEYRRRCENCKQEGWNGLTFN